MTMNDRDLENTKEEQKRLFFKKRQNVEQISEIVHEEKYRSEQDFQEMRERCRYYLHSYGVEEEEYQNAMRVIDRNYEELVTEFNQLQKQVEVDWEEEEYAYRKQQRQLEEKIEEARRESR